MTLSTSEIERWFLLDGQIALVTGAGHGIGRATALALAGAGGRVVLVGRRPEPLESAAKDIAAAGGQALTAVCDVADTRQIASLASRVGGTWGHIDILVNNAGILEAGPLDATDPEAWDRVLAVNLRGAFLCARAFVPGMREREAGVVVNVASISGQTGGVSANLPYASSKGGLIAFTKALARQMAPWGRANAVAPGQIDTAMGTRNPDQVARVVAGTPLRRLGAPEDVAAAILFLASPAAGFITGHVLNVNGGILMD